MSEHLVAMCYILLIAGVCFVVMAKPLTARLMAREDFVLRRNLFLTLTVVTFLAHSFWVATLVGALILAIAGRRERNPVALYAALLFAVPQFDMPISGIGVVNQLFALNHTRMLALVLLLPAALRLMHLKRTPNAHLRNVDLMVAAYFVYMFIVSATADSITGLMRYTVYVTLDYLLLYYVVTRSIVDRRRLFDVMASFVMGLAVIGVVGGFENVRSWLVYESLRGPLGIPPQDLGTYLLRETEDGGYLRAYATTGHAIALGYMSMVALVFQLAMARHYGSRWRGAALIAMPLIGLLASVSRGPWLGCAIVVTLGMMFGAGARKRLAWMAAALPVVIAALLILPQGQKFLDLLPFVGSVDPGSVDYRTQLIDRAWIVFWQNPIFGSLSYIYNPVLEEMRQGQGIIDIVNTYIGVALPYGVVGLTLFVAPSLYMLLLTWTMSRRVARDDIDSEALGRTLAMSLLGIILVIGAVSQIFHVPVVHWFVVALCAAYATYSPAWRKPSASAPGIARAQSAMGAGAGRRLTPTRRHA
jgi:hypothetical protein